MQGLVIAGINLLLLGSLGSGKDFGDVLRSAVPWIGGFSVAAAMLCSAGAVIGMRIPSPRAEVNWSKRLAVVLALATLFLVLSGGAVTTLEAGLAVPDWLTTFGYPMFFYPLELMQGDEKKFVEHFHRLWGALVGLCTICVVIHLWRNDARRWLRSLAIVVLLMVCVQGLMGASRVVDKSLAMAIFHGMFGQVVFATIVLLAACVSTTWKSNVQPQQSPGARADRGMAVGLLIMLLIQLSLGAMYRHLNGAAGAGETLQKIMLHIHITMAVLIAIKVPIMGVRAWGRYTSLPVLSRVGQSLLMIVFVQVVLGVGAFVSIIMRGEAVEPSVAEVILATAHQATGAIFLAAAVLHVAWTRRLLARA